MKTLNYFTMFFLGFALAFGIVNFMDNGKDASEKWQYAYALGLTTGVTVDHDYETAPAANIALIDRRQKDSIEFFSHFKSFK